MSGNLVKPLLSLYGTEWRDRGSGLWASQSPLFQYVSLIQVLYVSLPDLRMYNIKVATKYGV
jgi:hypothetical protein